LRRVEAEILKELDNYDRTVTELAERVEKSPGWVSEVVGDLAARNLVDKNGGVRIGDAYEARSLQALMGEYDIEQLLSGKREEILRSFAEQSQIEFDEVKRGAARCRSDRHHSVRRWSVSSGVR
jgi:Mn-dependent DtxR family transcriptional regulator